MKSLMNTLVKGLAGLLFVALVAVNVQVGTGNNLWGDGSSIVKMDQAKAGDVYCLPPYTNKCVEGTTTTGEKITIRGTYYVLPDPVVN